MVLHYWKSLFQEAYFSQDKGLFPETEKSDSYKDKKSLFGPKVQLYSNYIDLKKNVYVNVLQ